MRKSIILSCAGAVALAASLLISSAASQASTTSLDLSITGSTVAGFTGAQVNQELPVLFTITNHGSVATPVDFQFTVTNATASGEDYVCPTVGDRFNINPDTPFCEPGFLGAHRQTSAAILVTPTISSGTVTVQACANDEANHHDPTPGNNCKTISIPIS
ncbi:MAG TPA: hypothetical protein VFU36_14120 [Jatrophihabitans sp.]|nr:hypothetical protein [Jatrophihabitans sp.]